MNFLRKKIDLPNFHFWKNQTPEKMSSRFRLDPVLSHSYHLAGHSSKLLSTFANISFICINAFAAIHTITVFITLKRHILITFPRKLKTNSLY